MSTPEIKVGQHWQEVDPRYSALPIRVVVHIGEPYERKDLRTGVRREVRSVMLGYVGGMQKTTTTRSDRFNGKRGGYRLVKDVEPS